MNGTSHENQYTSLMISCSFLLRMRNVADRFVEKVKTHFLCSITFFFENRVVYEIMWKKMVERSRSQMTIPRMHRSCCVPKATKHTLRI
jgi:hypothetical protein